MRPNPAWVATAGALVFGAPVFAQAPCPALCEVSCLRPITIPDRWDDVTAIPGYTGGTIGGKRLPNWRNNSRWDSERLLNDTNHNGLYDPGDAYSDDNQNGIYDAEAFDPAGTGYNPGPSALSPAGDLGMELTLHVGSTIPSAPGEYAPVDFPAVNKGTPVTGGDAYRDVWASCSSDLIGPGDRCQLEPGSNQGPTNQAMRDLIAQDPDAYFDSNSQTIQGSAFTQSPRVILLSAHDPRVPINSGNTTVVVTRVLAFFMEQMVGYGEVQGRLVRAVATGTSCASGRDGFVVECPTSARAVTWGRMKGLYR